MKKKLYKSALILTTAAAGALFTGCASMQTADSSGLEEPVNTLAFTSPTDPHQLSKWTGSRYLFVPMQSQDIYYLQVPDTGYEPGRTTLFGAGRADYDTDLDSRDEVARVGDVDAREIGVGVGSSGTYGTGSGGTKVIRHQPGAAR